MRFMVMVKATQGLRSRQDALRGAARRHGQVQRGDGEGRRDARRQRAAAELQGRARALRRRQARRHGTKRTVIDGPFAETKELVAGYWILQCKSLAEAIEWIKRCPNPHDEESEIEIRQLFELEDFGESDAIEHHRRLGEQMQEVSCSRTTQPAVRRRVDRRASLDVTAEPADRRRSRLALEPSRRHDNANSGNAAAPTSTARPAHRRARS